MVLEELNHEVYIINTIKLKYLINVMISRKLLYSLKKGFLFLSAWKNIKTSSIHRHYDAIVIGSDIVWGNTQSPFFDKFFGVKLHTNKKIAYAPSCGEISYEQLSSIQQLGMKSINKFSARDKKTAELIKKVTNFDPIIVLDPTFLIDWSKYEIETEFNNFILIYSYKGNLKEMIIKAKEIAQETGKKIISVPNNLPWCDTSIQASPFEFLGFIKNADYVITDTFHGTVFSLIYRKKFISFPKSHKLRFLLDSFDIQHNKLFMDYKKIDYQLKTKKNISRKYIQESLK